MSFISDVINLPKTFDPTTFEKYGASCRLLGTIAIVKAVATVILGLALCAAGPAGIACGIIAIVCSLPAIYFGANLLAMGKNIESMTENTQNMLSTLTSTRGTVKNQLSKNTFLFDWAIDKIVNAAPCIGNVLV